MEAYAIVFWVTGIISVYSSYLILSAFSEREEVSVRGIILTGIVYYTISNIVYFNIEIPIVNLLMTLAFLFALSVQLNYSRKKIILSVVYTLLLLFIIDVLVMLSTGIIFNSAILHLQYSSILGRVLSVILAYAVGIGIRNYKNIGREIEIPVSYWLTLVIFPIFSGMLILTILGFSKYSTAWATFGIVTVLLMNILVFTLYDRLMGLYSKSIEDISVGYLNDSYKKQLVTMKANIQNTNSVQHDISRHLVSIQTLISRERFEEADIYVGEIINEYSNDKMVSKTGNTIIDSIINYEAGLLKIPNDLIDIHSYNLPPNLGMSDFEMTIVISNIVSNGLQAIKNLNSGRMEMKISYDAGLFFIEAVNDFDGVLREEDGRFLSRKRNANKHGYGLMNVKKVVDKYDGKMEMHPENKEFSIKIMMYVDAI